MSNPDYTIDARNLMCPKPIILTKAKLDSLNTGSTLTVVNDALAVENLTSFAQSFGYQVEQAVQGEDTYITIHKTEPAQVAAASQNIVIIINSNHFGTGAEDLSQALMKNYLYALKEVSIKPATLIFVNSGVFLTTAGDTVETLLELQDDGVEILSCGACLDFYGLKESLKVGSISNMYTIAETMNNAGKVIKI